MTDDVKRFKALDSWRGIAALSMVFYHIFIVDMVHNNPVSADTFVKNLWLVVDFFFILSGFVLTHRYFQNNFSLSTFTVHRLRRLIPLHFFNILIALLVFSSIYPRDMPLFPAFLMNLFDLQALSGWTTTLNGPSWSISVEFYVGLIFAAIFFGLNKDRSGNSLIIVSILGLGSLVFLTAMPTEQLLFSPICKVTRGLLGIGVGCLVYSGFTKTGNPIKNNWYYTTIEIFAVMGIAAGIYFYEKTSLIGPIIFFALGIFIFSKELGFVSTILKKKFFLKFGEISYSIYLNHFIIIYCSEKLLDEFGITHDMMIGSKLIFIVIPVFFAITIGWSFLTYKIIESPWQRKNSNAP